MCDLSNTFSESCKIDDNNDNNDNVKINYSNQINELFDILKFDNRIKNVICSNLESDEFYEFDGIIWKKILKNDVIDIIVEFLKINCYDKSSTLIFKLFDMIKIYIFIENFSSLLNTYTNLIGFKNGVYDINLKIFRKARSSDYLTRFIFYEYNENLSKTDQSVKHMMKNITKYLKTPTKFIPDIFQLLKNNCNNLNLTNIILEYSEKEIKKKIFTLFIKYVFKFNKSESTEFDKEINDFENLGLTTSCQSFIWILLNEIYTVETKYFDTKKCKRKFSEFNKKNSDSVPYNIETIHNQEMIISGYDGYDGYDTDKSNCSTNSNNADDTNNDYNYNDYDYPEYKNEKNLLEKSKKYKKNNQEYSYCY